MKITALFVQRTCAYPGQLGPELFEAVDHVTMEENPQFLQERIDTVTGSLGPGKEFASYALLDIEIDEAAVEAALNARTVLPGAITERAED